MGGSIPLRPGLKLSDLPLVAVSEEETAAAAETRFTAVLVGRSSTGVLENVTFVDTLSMGRIGQSATRYMVIGALACVLVVGLSLYVWKMASSSPHNPSTQGGLRLFA